MVLTASCLPQSLKVMITKKTLTPEKALYRAATLCSKCEQAEHDIRIKLKSWGISADESDTIIQRLIDEKYIDEERFALAFTRDKSRFDGWGRVKITYQLRLKHISQKAIDHAIAEIDEEAYTQSLRHILQAKMRTLKGKEPLQAKASLLRFALSRGFETDLIYRLLPEFIDYNDED